MSSTYQPGILAPLAPCGRSISFSVKLESDPKPALLRLRQVFNPDWGVVGIGEPLARALGGEIAGLRVFPALSGSPHPIPSDQHALWLFLRAENRGDIFDLSQKITGLLDSAFEVSDSVETFTYADSRDLTGYIDGTANPDAQKSIEVAIAAAGGAPGSSFVAVQRWAHDLGHFRAHSQDQRDAMIGRRIDDNEEIADAPEIRACETHRAGAFRPRGLHGAPLAALGVGRRSGAGIHRLWGLARSVRAHAEAHGGD